MSRIYTEVRISHKTTEEKQEYENKFDKALQAAGYKNRSEFIKEKIREVIKGSE